MPPRRRSTRRRKVSPSWSRTPDTSRSASRTSDCDYVAHDCVASQHRDELQRRLPAGRVRGFMKYRFVLIVLALASVSLSASAQGWDWKVVPYLWGPGID